MKTWLIPLSCIAIFSMTAQAQDAPSAPPGGEGPVRQACMADYQKFCPDVKPGGGRLMACAKAHKDELSQPCKDALAQARAAHRAAAQDCSAPPANPPKQ